MNAVQFFLLLNNMHFMLSMIASSKSTTLEKAINQTLENNIPIHRYPTTTQASFVMQVQTNQMRFILQPGR